MFRKSTLALALMASVLFGLVAPAAAPAAPSTTGTLGPSGRLANILITTPPAIAYGLTKPVGHLSVSHFRHGRYLGKRDLGKGTVTNVGVAILAALMAGGLGGGGAATSAVFNNQVTGTGTSSAAATDYQLQTAITSPGCTAGTLTNTSTAGSAQMKTVATFSYTGTSAVTEWGLVDTCTSWPTATTGSPFTATSSSGGTATGTPFTAHALQGYIITAGGTLALGVISDNTTSAITLLPQGWLLASNDATSGSTPGSTVAYTLLPGMLDHKVFSAVNVVSGDSIQFTYTLTLNSGG